MRTLNEIGADLESLDALLAEVGGDVTEEAAEAAVDAWLSELGHERDAKLDRYAAYIADLKARSDAKKAEAKRLTDRAKVEDNRVEMLKTRLLWFFQAQGLKKVETNLHAFTVANNGGKVPISLLVDPEALPYEYREHVVSYRAKTDEIRAKLEAGEQVVDATGQPVAILGQRGQSLRIK